MVREEDSQSQRDAALQVCRCCGVGQVWVSVECSQCGPPACSRQGGVLKAVGDSLRHESDAFANSEVVFYAPYSFHESDAFANSEVAFYTFGEAYIFSIVSNPVAQLERPMPCMLGIYLA